MEHRDPCLYNVYTSSTVGGKVVDVEKTSPDFAKLNSGRRRDGRVYLTTSCLPERLRAASSNEWAPCGAAPDAARLYHQTYARLPRQLHAMDAHLAAESGRGRDGRTASSRFAGGDKEREVTGRQWNRPRSHARFDHLLPQQPSILFWSQATRLLRRRDGTNGRAAQAVDPHGGRVMGYRDNDDLAANAGSRPSRILRSDDRQDPRRTPG